MVCIVSITTPLPDVPLGYAVTPVFPEPLNETEYQSVAALFIAAAVQRGVWCALEEEELNALSAKRGPWSFALSQRRRHRVPGSLSNKLEYTDVWNNLGNAIMEMAEKGFLSIVTTTDARTYFVPEQKLGDICYECIALTYSPLEN